MSTLLAIDTATEACSVALDVNGETLSEWALIPRQHSEMILPMVDRLLASAGLVLSQVDGIAFGRGPGAFTGVRIATAIVQGLAFATDKPVLPISTLAALAQQAARCHQATRVLAAIDARMDEIYWAGYHCSDDGVVEIIPEQVCAPEQVVLPADTQGWMGIGTGWGLGSRIPLSPARVEVDAYPLAEDIVRLAVPLFEQGKSVAAAQALPVYLRDRVAKKRHER
ncbi:tRNA (adenosine(37)-N6)-threonylcarbamoyltransferase complex dimerization subunit type 1 TsaB [Aestuariirhabdus litorea]|uniref:tRNA threonylcarbamoyladenosine biosynthesis protein TsaB n=1 Tax=Aestuariirhabdus litorea TaxID=2528527 RepID=A0A3P3VQS0_9GAMM|nr:tRNA (adenosine(37)-N6)-threonylcarbamoyltransferase complex dimerization subunit type 1 TsaB [Aestuariirhabdus litorea]RRJ85141.1 tRNA (adenosine(37)-N6)-threonylcarbamoyltransferase complex dimerization subunit type 1 TsaB [Aestuariirhabdus litorea]RWW98364.1 tRNA (adenosine(37)-N6)-threonylcarbamoyltransferase complex dimerization subunit type 1 TsaB [Endozoicomonadaceae bacterium GTF-13]